MGIGVNVREFYRTKGARLGGLFSPLDIVDTFVLWEEWAIGACGRYSGSRGTVS